MKTAALLRGSLWAAIALGSAGVTVACSLVWGFEDATLARDGSSFDAKIEGGGGGEGGADASTDGAIAPPSYVTISADAGGTVAFAVIDKVDGKLLIVSDRESNPNPVIFHCDLDGTNCTREDVTANSADAAGLGYGTNPHAVIDEDNHTLLIAATNLTNDFNAGFKPGLFTCKLDGGGCTYADISAGRVRNSGWMPTIAIDRANKKALVVCRDDTWTPSRLGLFRCNLDAGGCAYADISADQAAGAEHPSILLDPSGKLVVVASELLPPKFGLSRCNLDGTGCVYTSISERDAGDSFPSAIFANGLVVASSDQDLKANVFHCESTGLFCRPPLTVAPEVGTGNAPTALFDEATRRLLVVTRHDEQASLFTPSLYECNLDQDGGACTPFGDISAGRGVAGGSVPAAVLDTANHRLLIAQYLGSGELGLFRVALPPTLP